MALKQRQKLTQEQLDAVVMILCDPLGFARHVMPERLRVPKTRTDLPEHYRDRILISHEQRLMALDGMWFALARWRLPEQARGSRKVLARTARKTGKTTLGYELRYCWLSVINPKGKRVEALLHAPNEVHLAPVETRIYSAITESRLLRALFQNKNSERGIWSWKTSITWHHRIEGEQRDRAGRNMVGIVATAILGDEGGYSRSGAYAERRQVAVPDCVEFWGGVPRPIEFGIFKDLTIRTWEQMERGERAVWSIHANPPEDSPLWKNRPQRYDMRANPLFHSDKAFYDQLGTGTWDSEENKTQVLGLEGTLGSRAFNTIPRAPIPFYLVQLNDRDVEVGNHEAFISSIPFFEVADQAQEWRIGIDYGFNPSPMQILVLYRNEDMWYEYARIETLRCDTYDAARIVHVLDSCLPELATAVCIDTHGQGRGLGDTLVKGPQFASARYDLRLIHAAFNTSIDDTRTLIHKTCRNRIVASDEEAMIYSCPVCNEYVDQGDIAPRRVQAKELLTTDIMEAFSYTEDRLDGKESEPGRYGIVLASDDTEFIRNLEGTVAVEFQRTTRFESPDGADHITDALRAFAMTMRTEISGATMSPANSILEELGVYDLREAAFA